MRNLILLLYFFSFSVFGQLTDVHRQDLPFKNWIKNSGYENQLSNWTVTTDTLVLTTGTSKQERGKSYLTWNSAGASRVLTHEAVTVDEGMKGNDVLCGYQITTASGTATHFVRVYDGTNVLASATVTSSTLPTWTYVTVPAPSSGTIQCQLVSVNADEPSIDITSSYMGRNYLISDVSQAVFVGSAYIAGTASCSWVRTSTTIGAYGTDTDCPGPTVLSNPGPGTIQTTDADLPRFTVNSLPPGNYHVEMSFTAYGTTAGETDCYAIYDGTTTSKNTCQIIQANSRGAAVTISYDFTYTTTANISYEIYTASTANNSNLENNAGPPAEAVKFNIYRYPSVSEQAFRPDQGPSRWSGYNVAASCSWAVTNTSYTDFTADADCNLVERTNVNFGTVTNVGGGAAETPGIVFTPTRVGGYYVCALVRGEGATTGQQYSYKLWDGTTTIAESSFDAASGGQGLVTPVCGIYNATSIASKSLSIQGKGSSGAITIGDTTSIGVIEWSIVATDFSMNVPLLLSKYAYNGSVTSTSCAGWTLTSTSYADFAGDADCDLTATNNINFGTVISSGGATETPGITFTPPVTGMYYVCVTPGILGSGAAGTALSVRLTDGTTQIAEADEDQPVVSYVENIPLCGLWNATSTSSTTIKIQGKASTGSVSIRRDTAAQMFQWNIFKL